MTTKSFINFLLESVVSVGDDNVMGGLINSCKKNLSMIKKKFPSQKDTITELMCAISTIEQNPGVSFSDGFSTMSYLQQLSNPKISIDQLSHIRDALSSYSNDSGD